MRLYNYDPGSDELAPWGYIEFMVQVPPQDNNSDHLQLSSAYAPSAGHTVA